MMKLFVAVFGLMLASHVFADEQKYDLTDKNQFSFYFRDQWETMFNKPQPIANPAKDTIVGLLAPSLNYQPCYKMARTDANEFYKQRLIGMQHAFPSATVTASRVLPLDPTNNKPSAVLEMTFEQETNFLSYTDRFFQMKMTLKARKEEVDKEYRIYDITDTCENI